MEIVLNGQPRMVELPANAPTVEALTQALGMKADRVAVERNGEIVRRADWAATPVAEGDRFEVVHFVGGGSGAALICDAGNLFRRQVTPASGN